MLGYPDLKVPLGAWRLPWGAYRGPPKSACLMWVLKAFGKGQLFTVALSCILKACGIPRAPSRQYVSSKL